MHQDFHKKKMFSFILDSCEFIYFI